MSYDSTMNCNANTKMFQDWVRDQAKAQFQTMIVNYREDPDLQNLIVSWADAILVFWKFCVLFVIFYFLSYRIGSKKNG